MKFEIETEAIQISTNAIAKCADAADATSPHKMFWLNIKKDGKLNFVAQDSKGFYSSVAPVNKATVNDMDGDNIVICLPFAEFKDLAKQSTSDILQVEVEDSQIIVRFKGSKSKYKLRRGSVAMPEAPELDERSTIELDAQEFCLMLDRTVLSVFNDPNTSYSSIQFNINKKGALAYSTDTAKASRFIIEEDNLYDDDYTLMIPKTAVERLSNMIFGEKVKIYLSDSYFTIKSGSNFLFHGPQGKNDKPFPPIVEKCFDNEVQASFYVDKVQLKKKLSISGILDKESKIKMKLDGKILSLDTKGDMGEAIDEISVTIDPDYKNDEVRTVIVDSKNLIAALDRLDDDEANIRFMDTIAALKKQNLDSFLIIQEKSWTYLFMPLSEKSGD